MRDTLSTKDYLIGAHALKYAHFIVSLTNEIRKTNTSKYHAKTNVIGLLYNIKRRSPMSFDPRAMRAAVVDIHSMIDRGILVSTQIIKPRVMTFITVPIAYTPRWYTAHQHIVAQDIEKILHAYHNKTV